MLTIKTINKIAKVGLDVYGNKYSVSPDIENPDAIMVRSEKLHDMEFGSNLRAIARCGAGVNNIPVERCAEAGIVVFNTPGANANGVKELALCALLLASRDVIGGVEWVKTIEDKENISKLVEKGKSTYGGCEIAGKTLGVIGLGAIGGMVANAAKSLGMKVIGYDPYLSVTNALNLSRAVEVASSYDEIYKRCDYISLHVPATKETTGLIGESSLAMMKDGVKIINLSRAELVDGAAMKAAIDSGRVSVYVTDFATGDMVGYKNTITTPHLGACTEESEDNCAVMAAHELCDFLENGNIVNSVNYPTVSIPHTGIARLCVSHKNVPAVLSKITTAVSEQGLNIENMANASKGDFSYTIVETNTAVPDEVVAKVTAIEGVVKVTLIK